MTVNLINGMEYIDHVGKVVTLDAETRHGSFSVTGELTSVLDQFQKPSQQGDVAKTILTIGGERIVLDWHDNRTKADIELRS